MSDDFILQGRSAVSVPVVPPSAPPLDEEGQESFEAGAATEERLANEAWREAGRWKRSAQRHRCRRLEVAWRDTAKLLAGFLQPPQRLSAAAPGALQSLG